MNKWAKHERALRLVDQNDNLSFSELLELDNTSLWIGETGRWLQLTIWNNEAGVWFSRAMLCFLFRD